jgi:hypothetical protein
MDISKISYTVLALLIGAASVGLGLTGGFTYSSSTINIAELWARIVLILFGAIVVGSSLIFEFYRRAHEQDYTQPKPATDTRPLPGKGEAPPSIQLFALDDDASRNFSEIVKGARRVSILSRTAVNLLGEYLLDFEKLLDDACTVRLLIVDPESAVCSWLYGGSPEVFGQNLSTVRHHIERLRKKGGHRFEARVMPHAPTFGLIWLENRDSARDTLYVHFYFLHGPGNRKRPIMTLPGTARWSPIFIDDFEKVWDEARPWRDPLLANAKVSST